MSEITKENPLGMKNISEVLSKNPAEIWSETMKKSLTYDWVFNRWYEKIIISICGVWSVYSLGSYLWRLFN